MLGLLRSYSFKTAGAVLTPEALRDQLGASKVDAGRAATYTELYDYLADTKVTDAEFHWSVNQLREILAETRTKEAIAAGLQALRDGAVPDDEVEDPEPGHVAARAVILEAFSDIDRDLNTQASPEGDVAEEREKILREYAERKAARLEGKLEGIRFGITALDNVLGGLQTGELVLTVGYSSDGKTSICTQLAWHAAVMQGKNVVFMTTETSREVVTRKLLGRHSKLPLFGLPEGLNTRDIKGATLNPADEAKWEEVVTDFTNNPRYGKRYIMQVPNDATVALIESKLYALQRKFHIDLVVFDYLGLLESRKRRDTDREELSNILKASKVLARTFDNGRGIPFVSPWQVSRQARDNAEKLGFYTSASLAQTAEATNSPDVIISLLADERERENRHRGVLAQVLKNRDGATANGIELRADYATSYFQSRDAGGAANNFGGYSQPSGLGELGLFQ